MFNLKSTEWNLMSLWGSIKIHDAIYEPSCSITREVIELVTGHLPSSPKSEIKDNSEARKSLSSFHFVKFSQVPFTSAVFIHDSWPWGEFICKASEFTKDLSIGVSVFTLTALSGDRFFAIVDPLRKFHSHSGRRATRITIGIAVLIWILAGVMGIPAIKASHIKVRIFA